MIEKEELTNKNGEPASLYDVCEWFIQTYPDDVFIGSKHPVHKIRDLCKEVIKMKNLGVKERINYDIKKLFSKKRSTIVQTSKQLPKTTNI